MPWKWDPTLSRKTSYLIGGDHKRNILTQLANSNRIILPRVGPWTSDDIKFYSCYIWEEASITYIWLTNDQRRKLLKALA